MGPKTIRALKIALCAVLIAGITVGYMLLVYMLSWSSNPFYALLAFVSYPALVFFTIYLFFKRFRTDKLARTKLIIVCVFLAPFVLFSLF